MALLACTPPTFSTGGAFVPADWRPLGSCRDDRAEAATQLLLVGWRRIDDPGARFGGRMPTALLISAALAASIVVPISASAKEHRSASVKR
jgi:hypothetical protein